jgi:hypothetical protein
MRHQAASTMIALSLREVERRLADVESWPRFLIGLDSAERIGHERYRFRLRDGRDRREATVVVRWRPADSSYTWRALEGPTYVGRLESKAVDDKHTVVSLALTCHPGCLSAGLAEMVMPGLGRAEHDLRNLEQLLLGAPDSNAIESNGASAGSRPESRAR